MSPGEQALINDPNLTTAESKHAATVLLAHLREIKANAGVALNQQLDQGGPGHADNWLIKDQAAIDIAITTMIPGDQYQALKDYKAAAEMVRVGADPDRTRLDIAAKALA